MIQNATVKGDAISYPPDENDLEIRRGAVGMRVQGFDGDKKLVKSQFYIVLGESEPADRYFSYVFGYVIEGCDVCDLVSESNSSQQKFTISDLGLVSWMHVLQDAILCGSNGLISAICKKKKEPALLDSYFFCFKM